MDKPTTSSGKDASPELNSVTSEEPADQFSASAREVAETANGEYLIATCGGVLTFS
jgi:hypothetical protein